MRVAIHRRAFPAAALAVTHRGALIALQGFGRFTFEVDSPPVEPDTVFDLASVTKVVATTAMAMLLYERRQLRLDAPIADVLPEFVSLAPSSEKNDRAGVTPTPAVCLPTSSYSRRRVRAMSLYGPP